MASTTESNDSVAKDEHHDEHHHSDVRLHLERRISHQAVDEGHDADIPSGEGYILDEKEKRQRRESFASRRRKSDATRDPSTATAAAAASGITGRDVEKEAGLTGPPENDTETDSDDPNIVWWDGDDDPENPYNWPRWRTLVNCVFISFMVFLTPLASSMFAPGVPQLMIEFRSQSAELAAFVVSVYVLGFAAGPLIVAPMSELYGRLIIYHVCNIGFVVFVIACAKAPTMGSLIAFRFLSGIFGSCPITNGGGSIADMVPQERRAAAMAGFAIGPLLGPIIGPIVGGFLANAKGWRWDFWLLAIVGGFLTVVMIFTMKETYHPVILERRTARLRKETGNPLLRSKLDIGLSPADYFKRGIIRPLKMLTRSPIIVVMSLYIAIVYGYLYLMFTSMTIVFEEYYGFSTSLVGLAFIGLGIGSLLGVGIYSGTSDKYIQRKAAKADAVAAETGGEKEGLKPEYRLPTLPLGGFLLPVGLFIYGWTAEKHVHWIVPIIGTGFIGCGNIIVFMAIQMYLVDAFSIYAASAIAANTVVRSVVGAVLPLAGLPMYNKLRIGWGNSVLGFIALALVPVTFLIIKYGETLRKKFPIKNL